MQQYIKRSSTRILLLTVAILLKAAIVFIYFDNSGDKILQTAAAVNLSQGLGYSTTVVDPSNVDSSYQKPMILWPPAYSASISLLIRIGMTPLHASFAIDLIQAAIFLMLILWLTQMLGFPFWCQAFFLLFKALEINEAIRGSWPTDYMSLNTWLIAICSLVQYVQTKRSFWLWIFIAANCLSPWIRYANLPLVPILPLIMMILGYRENAKVNIVSGIYALIAAIASAALLLGYNYFRSGAFMFSPGYEQGIYLTNLFHFPPVFWMSFFDVKFVQVQFSNITGLSYETTRALLQVTSTFFLVIMFLQLGRYLNTSSYNSVKQRMLLLMVGIVGACSTLLLAWLSIRNNGQHHFDHWTFIEEERYMLLITLGISLYIFQRFVARKKNLLTVLVVLAMSADALHGIWVVSTKLKRSSSIVFMKSSPETIHFIETEKATAAKENTALIIADYRYSVAGLAAIHGIPVLSDMRFDPGVLELTKRKSRILYRVDRGHEARFPELFMYPGVSSRALVNFNHFYSLDIHPRPLQ